MEEMSGWLGSVTSEVFSILDDVVMEEMGDGWAQ